MFKPSTAKAHHHQHFKFRSVTLCRSTINDAFSNSIYSADTCLSFFFLFCYHTSNFVFLRCSNEQMYFVLHDTSLTLRLLLQMTGCGDAKVTIRNLPWHWAFCSGFLLQCLYQWTSEKEKDLLTHPPSVDNDKRQHIIQVSAHRTRKKWQVSAHHTRNKWQVSAHHTRKKWQVSAHHTRNKWQVSAHHTRKKWQVSEHHTRKKWQVSEHHTKEQRSSCFQWTKLRQERKGEERKKVGGGVGWGGVKRSWEKTLTSVSALL